jgi:hypothetical protein
MEVLASFPQVPRIYAGRATRDARLFNHSTFEVSDSGHLFFQFPVEVTLDQMKAFVRNHFEDFVNKRKAAVIRTNMAPEFYDHDGPGGKPTGVEGDEKMMLAMYKSMPDLRLEIEDIIAEGDKVRQPRAQSGPRVDEISRRLR